MKGKPEKIELIKKEKNTLFNKIIFKFIGVLGNPRVGRLKFL